MNAVALPLTAQIGAELKMRLRSLATPIALVAFFAAAFFWIPDPHGNAASITWDLADGRVQAPLYSAAYVGFALAILSGIFLTMGGFYLVAGTLSLFAHMTSRTNDSGRSVIPVDAEELIARCG